MKRHEKIVHWACVSRPRIPENGHCLGGDLLQLAKLLVQFVGHELRELADRPIDLRLVFELIEVPGDERLRELPLNDKFLFDIAIE